MPASAGDSRPACTLSAVAEEALLLSSLAVPSSIANLNIGLSMAVIIIISPQGEDAIAGAGMGLMWTNVTANSVFVGVQFGFGALCAQAYGARNFERVGILLHRALLVCWLLCIGIAYLWLNTENILLALGQPAAVSHFAGLWTRWQLPSLAFIRS